METSIVARRRGRPPKELAGFSETRETLLRAGVAALTEKGFSATGIDEILRSVNVPKGSFYHYFGSKESFGAELIDIYAAYFARKLDRILTDPTRTPLERLRDFVADAEAGFGGNLNAFELTKSLIRAGAAGVHFEDQLSSAKKCGHMGGKVLIPSKTAVRNLMAARLAADLMGVPTVIVARTDANGAHLITSDVDPYDRPFITGERTEEGFFHMRGGLDAAISRGLAYAPYADLIWCETSEPNIDEARRFAGAILEQFPGKRLAYNCSPSFNWKMKLAQADIETFQQQLAAMGYLFQFITLAGFHALNHSMFELARAYKARGMAAYSELQQAEFASEQHGYTATRHQREVGAGYFDEIAQVVSEGKSSTTALDGSTESEQFHPAGVH